MHAPPRLGARLAYALPLLAYALLAWRFAFLCDDAFISFRFARHLAAGEGPVFNLGQVPPVEGYTNFLWVLACALLERLGLNVPLASRWLSAALGGLLLLWLLASARRRLGLEARGLLAGGLFLATLPPFALWATGGLETMALALALFVLWQRLLSDPARRHGWSAGLAAVAAALLRADGILWCATLLAAGALLWLLRGRERALGRALCQASALLMLGFGIHLLWRHAYYGDWLPHTARVKVGFSYARLARGGDYVATFFLASPALIPALLLATRRHPRETRELWLPAAAMLAVSLAYAAWVGGDFMPFGRFLFPAVPFVALLYLSAWKALDAAGGLQRALRAVLAVGLPLCSLAADFDHLPFPRSFLERFHFRLGREWRSEIARWEDMSVTQRRWSLVGEALARHTRLGESIILAGLGAQAYPNELYVYDNFGLVTPEVVAGATVAERATPGHDLHVPPHFFFPPPYGNFGHKPTYLGAMLACRPEQRVDGRPPWWVEDLPADWSSHPYSKLVAIEEYPLEEAEGFPAGASLLLLRFRWAPR